MKSYGQFCPVAKAAELFCERWTALILRDLALGATRFSELQRGVPLASPTILARRHGELAAGRHTLSGASERGLALDLSPDVRLAMLSCRWSWRWGTWGQRWSGGTAACRRYVQEARQVTLDPRQIQTLQGVSTASITTILLKKGLRNVWMRGPRALAAGQGRVVGRAFTLRFVPAREDLATPKSWASPRSTRAAIEEMPAGCVVVVDALGVTDAGIFGDILCGRMRQRQVAALVTDGALRDLAGIRGVGLPVWCNGIAAPPSVAGLTFVGWQEPVGCGGVAVFPTT